MAAHLPLFPFLEIKRTDRESMIQRPFAEILPAHTTTAEEPGISGPAVALDRRTHLRLAQPLTPIE
jgi:hypothetical protein